MTFLGLAYISRIEKVSKRNEYLQQEISADLGASGSLDGR